MDYKLPLADICSKARQEHEASLNELVKNAFRMAFSEKYILELKLSQINKLLQKAESGDAEAIGQLRRKYKQFIPEAGEE